MDVPSPISETHGIAALSNADLRVYSIGISTRDQAGIRMAKLKPARLKPA